ncbi:ATP-binding protein [Myxococcus sp. RHSTA-1-4]|uniref:ATP-binding protein n=1 Tax=Myxococcus sp. RHSTA-1-4 TaxID=2874601 RepID=UPI001CC17B61|nr:ATP-binding protein [Myxococcus sp. RHSTA-1-4]MBZ4420210.1 ATP-binding protein [Myxococcus sp. RHSTA-1-4]
METLLTQWLDGGEATSVLDVASVSEVRERVRAVGRAQGLPETSVERMTLVVSELANNQLSHGRGGAVVVRPLWRGGVPGLEVIAADRGPGIADPTAALRGLPRSTGSLGAGLAGVLHQADEVDFDVRWDEGTCVRARKFATPPLVRRELGVLGRPYQGESVSGDHASWEWRDDTLVLGVVDGLGHGPEARVAADHAVAELRACPGLAPEEVLNRCATRLHGTRGAAVGVVSLELGSGLVRQSCVGNVHTLLCAPGHMEAMTCMSGALGVPQRTPRPRGQSARLPPGGLLVMHTDGLATRTTVDDPVLLRRPPIEVAHALLLRFGKQHDDALVVVARGG